MRLDLHIHSYFSDGEFSPERITNEVTKRGISLFSITDHNILSNTEKTKEYAIKNNTRHIDGIEISTMHRTSNVNLSLHILGYGKKLDQGLLNKNLQQTIDGYNHRAFAIINKLNKIFPDLALDFQSVRHADQEAYVSRNTLARIIVAYLNNTISIKDVLKQYVFVEEENDDWMMSPKESFELITRANGIPILAHSGRELRKLGPIEYQKLIGNLASFGLLGLEVYYPKHTSEETDTLKTVAHTLGLYMTGGSDWHGKTYTPDIEVGRDISNGDIAAFLSDKRMGIL